MVVHLTVGVQMGVVAGGRIGVVDGEGALVEQLRPGEEDVVVVRGGSPRGAGPPCQSRVSHEGECRRFILECRVRAVSSANNPFSSDAIAILREASSGGLRDIDRLATNALRHAASRKVRIVDRSVVGKIVGNHLNNLVD